MFQWDGATSRRGSCVDCNAIIATVVVVASLWTASEAFAAWSPSGRIHPSTPFPEQSTDIAIGADGVPIVVWDFGEIWWAKWDEGCSCWSSAATVNMPNAVGDEYPRISIGSDNVPWVVWSQRFPAQAIWGLLSSRLESGAWTVPDTVLVPSGANDIYDIAAISGSDAWVSSEKPGETGKEIVALHYENSRWVQRGILNAGSDNDFTPAIAVDIAGAPWIAWAYLSPIQSTIHAATLVQGQWITYTLAERGLVPAIAAVQDKVIVVWSALDPDPHRGQSIAYRFWTGKWSSTAFVNQADSLDTTDISPAISAYGTDGPIVVWTAGLPFSWERDTIASRWTGSSWTPEYIICIPDSVVTGRDEYPSVALGPMGEVWASWRRSETSEGGDIWYARGNYSSTSVADHSLATVPSISILLVQPNPTRGPFSASYIVHQAADYEAVITEPTGRIIDIMPLGVLSAGVYNGSRALRWPSSTETSVKTGVYFLGIRQVGSSGMAAKTKIVVLH